MATKPKGGGVKALVVGPLIRTFFLRLPLLYIKSLNKKQDFFFFFYTFKNKIFYIEEKKDLFAYKICIPIRVSL